MDEQAVRAAFERALTDESAGATFLHRFLGVRITADPVETTVEFDHQPQFANRRGMLHGGITALLFDIAMGNLHRAALGPGITLELKTQYLAAIPGGTVTCRARFLKAGSQVSFLEARMTDESGKLLAAATATWVRAR